MSTAGGPLQVFRLLVFYILYMYTHAHIHTFYRSSFNVNDWSQTAREKTLITTVFSSPGTISSDLAGKI